MLTSCVVFLLSTALGVLATDSRCPEQDNPEIPVHLPHSSDCGKFLTCLWGDAIEQSCPEGLYWNDKYQYCDWPANVECTSGQKEESAYCISGQLMPHVEDCNKFYACVHGKHWELRCHAGLHFNPSAQVCDYPVSAGCEVPSTTTTAAVTDATAETEATESEGTTAEVTESEGTTAEVTESEGTTAEVTETEGTTAEMTESEGTPTEESPPGSSTEGTTEDDQTESTDTTSEAPATTTENDDVSETSATSSGSSEYPETHPTETTTGAIDGTTHGSDNDGQEESSATETQITETTTDGTTPAV